MRTGGLSMSNYRRPVPMVPAVPGHLMSCLRREGGQTIHAPLTFRPMNCGPSSRVRHIGTVHWQAAFGVAYGIQALEAEDLPRR